MDITLSLDQYINYAGNLLRCIFKRTVILQKKAEEMKSYSEIAKDKIIKSMEEVIEDTQTLEMETCLNYEGDFPHGTYWAELRIYCDKYKQQPWDLYNVMKNNIGNGLYASFLRYYALGLVDDIRTLETWAEEVRI